MKWQRFAKIDGIDEATRTIHGTFVEEVPDKSGEIFDYETSKPYMVKWNNQFQDLTSTLNEPSVGNVREMHTKKAAGKVTSIAYDDLAKRSSGIVKVVDDDAWKKCCEGVYTGFSIGGNYIRVWDDPVLKTASGKPVKRYTADPHEVSLVDNPCMYGATFTIKSADGTEKLAKFVGSGTFDRLIEQISDVTVLEKLVKMSQELDKTAKTKTVDGEELPMSAFLIHTDPDKTDTWKLPVHFSSTEKTVSHIRNAMSRFNQTEGATNEHAKALISLAQSHGIQVQSFGKEVVQQFYGRALRKGMYDVSNMAEMFTRMCYLQSSISDEAEREGDGSTIGARLKSLVLQLQQIFVDLATEESSELIAEKAEKLAKNHQPHNKEVADMEATELLKLRNQIDGLQDLLKQATGTTATTPAELTKVKSTLENLLTKAKDVSGKMRALHTKMQATHAAMQTDCDGMSTHMGKAADPMHKHVSGIIKSHDAMAAHLDTMDDHIEDMESAASAEDDKNMSSNRAERATEKMTKRFERTIERMQKTHESEMGSVLGAFGEMLAKAVGGGSVATDTPVRTGVPVEKSADTGEGAAGGGTPVGGMPALNKGAGASAATGGESPVDSTGMPRPEFLAKLGDNGGEMFVKAAAAAKPQTGDPFPQGSNLRRSA